MSSRSKKADSTKKPRPPRVPEENVYNRLHWTLVIGLAACIAAGYFAFH